MKESARIDKWLWAARIYKTRSIAADACKNGRVMVGGVTRKPSFIIKRGDVVSVKKISYFDQLARDAFRLDFSARMALARLEASAGLSVYASHHDAAILTGIGSNAAGLVNAGSPEPLVYSC